MKQKRERRKFDAALKIEMVRRMQERVATGVPVAVIATDLQVRPAQLRSWAKQLTVRAGQAPRDVFPGEGRLPSADEELRQLRRELDVVRQERDFLKRAAAYFAKESR